MKCRNPFCHQGRIYSLSEEQMAEVVQGALLHGTVGDGTSIAVLRQDPVPTVDECPACSGTGVQPAATP